MKFRIRWSTLNGMTTILYVLSLIFIPINVFWSTILLFGIVGLWSRIPGMGYPILSLWLMLLDVVDFFAVIIAINIGGWQGAVFSLCVNFGSVFFAEDFHFIFMLKDSLAVFLACLIIPFVHNFTQNIVLTMALFTLIRAFWFIPQHIIIPTIDTPEFILKLTQVTISLYLINTFYAMLFGDFLDSILATGINFSWLLFLFVTSIIVGTKIRKRIKNARQNKIIKKEIIQNHNGYRLA